MNKSSEPFEAWLASVSTWIQRLPGLRRIHPLSGFACLILFAWSITNWILSLRLVIRDYNPLPVWDYWQVAEHLQRYKALDLSVFWIQHNEHRIVFPELVFAADMLFFHGHQIFAVLVSLCCYVGVWLVFARALSSDETISPTTRNVGILFASIIIAWPGCSIVLGNTFLLQWTMLQFTVALALLLLTASRRSLRFLSFFGVILCGIIATFSSGNGMLIWPVLVAAAVVLRMPLSRTLSLAVAGLVSIYVYFIGYQSPAELSVLRAVQHPIYFLGFVSSYLSMPLGALGQPTAAVGFGTLNLLSFLLLLWLAARKRLLAETPSVVLFGVFLFTLGSAAITAVGRMDLAEPRFLAALAARYLTVPLVNWAALVVVFLWISSRLRWELLSTATISVLTFLCLIGLTSALRPYLTGNGSFIANKQVATVSVENGLLDPGMDGRLYSDPGFIPRMLPVLRQNHVAIYADTPAISLVGKAAGALPGACAAEQGGKISRLIPVTGGFEVIGNIAAAAADSKIVFVGENGRIVGFGEVAAAGKPDDVTEPPEQSREFWIGFVNSSFGAKSFAAFTADENGRLACRLAESRILGAGHTTEAQASAH